MHAEVKWVEGMTFIGRSESGHSIVLGSRPGEDDPGAGAPTPMELVLLAVGGCTAIDVISILQKKRQTATGFRIHLNADRVDDYPRIFSKIEMEYIFEGDLDQKAVEDAVQLSQDKYCSVSAMVGAAVPISYTVRIGRD